MAIQPRRGNGKGAVAPKPSNLPTMTELAGMVSEATQADMSVIMAAKEDVVRGPLVIGNDLADDLGPERMAVFPIVDSFNEDGKPPVWSNPDQYSIAKSMANGGSRQVKAWHTKDFADKTAQGIEIDAAIAACTAKISDQLVTGAAKVEAKKERGYWQGRKSVNRNTYRRAIAWWQQTEAFKTLPLISVKVLTDNVLDDNGHPVMNPETKLPETEITTSKMAIKVWEKADPENYVVVTLTTFLSFDPALALANGGTLQAVVDTAEREGSGGTTKGATALAFKDVELACARLNKLLQQDNIGLVFAKEASKAETGKVFAHTICDTYLMLQPICEPMLPIYQAVEDEATAKLAADRKEAADKYAANIK